MTISRWKVMAGVLGMSIGGLAAFAGQCPKPGDAHRTSRADDAPKVIPDAPKLPPAGSGPMIPIVPTAPADVTPPALPVVPPVGGSAPKAPAPDLLPPVPTKSVALPDLPAPPAPKVTEPVFTPPKPELTPVGGVAPAVPPPVAGLSAPAPAALVAPESPKATPTGGTTGITLQPPATPASVNLDPPAPPPVQGAPLTPPVTQTDPLLSTPQNRPQLAPDRAPAAAPAVAKFRILLRVGEGEPMFEVRQGDDLMMKVVCEKVDIKSPEKGNGPSAVTATGKVRFVGFGAEGTCDQLSFMAGTGEVTMNGGVKIQVKDKLGRVESELTSDKMHYKLDAGGMRP